ncbi:MAG: hypothetical protein LBD50_03195, partial [Rickettsiales bacterium]|nr:hypothetical protein [Rickettsiales bacterium]
MKKIIIFSTLMALFVLRADAASPQGRGMRSAPSSSPASSQSSAPAASSARAAVRTTAARSAAPAAANSARAAMPRATAARSGATPAGSVISARAGVTQKVIGSGTKISAAVGNVIVDENCKQKYYGCMDSFCMVENTSGGRCICSNRNSELDSILAEIEKLDAQSYKMATEGVEKIEMGADATAVMEQAKAVASGLNEPTDKASGRKKTLDLSLWNVASVEEEEDSFASDQQKGPLDGKTGDSLHLAVQEMCVAQMPECSNDMQMLRTMYSQNVKSDCTAYENELKRQKTASASKLSAAEKALRESALEQLRAANKYDLGQCTIKFKECMSTTGGCGDDFKGCVGIAAAENAKASGAKKSSMKMVDIKGLTTKISIAASTMDALDS